MIRHPCFDEQAHRLVGRLHLPVASRCNIRCAYCERKIGCLNESRPGISTRVITPAEVTAVVSRALELEPRIEVVGIAGPGEALANEETFETLKLVRKRFPDLRICLATNGLALPERLPYLLASGVEFLSVTVSAATPVTGARLVKFVLDRQRRLSGPEGAALLLARQLQGIALAAKAGIRVKVNSVLVPGVNDQEMAEIARLVAEAGASIMNIIPLIPLGDFRGQRPPNGREIRKARRAAARFMPLFLSCKRCRADAFGVPGQGDCAPGALCL